MQDSRNRSSEGMCAPGPPVIYRAWRLALRVLFGWSCRVWTRNAERTRLDGPWILASNHISHFDPPLLSTVVHRHIDWMAMQELFGAGWFAPLLRGVGAFPVARGKPDRAALRAAVRRLAAGRVVGIFPEGGLRDGAASVLEQGKMRPGLGLVAGLAKAQVVPCVVLGTDRLYNLRRWRTFRGTPVWIAFGEPLAPPGSAASGREEFENRLRGALRALAEELKREHHLTAADLPHPPKTRQLEP